MKKLSILFAAVALLAACSQKEEITPQVDENAIQFSAYSSASVVTRGVVQTTEVFNSKGIGVYAFYQPKATGKFNTYKYATPNFMYNQNVKPTVTHAAVYYSDVDEYNEAKGTSLTEAEFAALPDADKIKVPTQYGDPWSYEPIKYWPNNEGDMLSFFAYAPYDVDKAWEDMGFKTDVNAKKLTTSFAINQEVVDQVDYLYATPVLNRTKQAVDANGNNYTDGINNIKFDFKHITSQVNLYVGVEQNTATQQPTTWNDANTTIEVQSIVFKGLSNGMTYTYDISSGSAGDPDITLSKVKQDITLTEDHFTSNKTINDQAPWTTAGFYKLNQDNSVLFLVPEKLGKVVITYEVTTTDATNSTNSSTITNIIESDMSNVTLEAGKSYKFNFLIGMNSVKIVASLTDWVDVDPIQKDVPANNPIKIWNKNGDDYENITHIEIFKTGAQPYFSVDNVDLDATNTDATKINAKLYHVKDYAAKSIKLANLTEAMIAGAGVQNGLRLSLVNNGLDNITTTPDEFTNKIVQVVTNKLKKDSVYAFEYTDKYGEKRYRIIKVEETATTAPKLTLGGPMSIATTPAAITNIGEGESFTMTVEENSTAVTGLKASNFSIQPAHNFTIEETSTAGTYKFTASTIDASTQFTILMNGIPEVNKKTITVDPYTFDKTTVKVRKDNSKWSDAILLQLAGSAATGATKADFELTGTKGVTIKGKGSSGEITGGEVYLIANVDATATNGKLICKKGSLVVAECAVELQTYGFSNTQVIIAKGTTETIDLYLDGAACTVSSLTTDSFTVVGAPKITVKNYDASNGKVTLEAPADATATDAKLQFTPNKTTKEVVAECDIVLLAYSFSKKSITFTQGEVGTVTTTLKLGSEAVKSSSVQKGHFSVVKAGSTDPTGISVSGYDATTGKVTVTSTIGATATDGAKLQYLKDGAGSALAECDIEVLTYSFSNAIAITKGSTATTTLKLGTEVFKSTSVVVGDFAVTGVTAGSISVTSYDPETGIVTLTADASAAVTEAKLKYKVDGAGSGKPLAEIGITVN